MKQKFLFGKNYFFTSGLFFYALSFLDGCFLFVCLLFYSVFTYLFCTFCKSCFSQFLLSPIVFQTYFLIWVFFDLSFLSSFWLFVSFVFFLKFFLSLPLTPFLEKKKVLQIASLFSGSSLFKNKCPELIVFFYLSLFFNHSFLLLSSLSFLFSNVFLTPKNEKLDKNLFFY